METQIKISLLDICSTLMEQILGGKLTSKVFIKLIQSSFGTEWIAVVIDSLTIK